MCASLVDSRVLPFPSDVLSAIVEQSASGELWFHLSKTLVRVCIAFVLAMIIGSAIGIALGMRRGMNDFFDPWVVLLLNIPALVIIVLGYIWFGLNEITAISAVAVNKIPNVIVTLREGARAMDAELNELAQVYQFSALKKLRHVILPQLQPFFSAATRSGISLIWKIVLVVELLGRSNGVGFQIHLYFQLFDVATILAYTFAFVFVMLAVEFLILQKFEESANRWRRSNA
jgi:NitT/TauT family transport system permease protein